MLIERIYRLSVNDTDLCKKVYKCSQKEEDNRVQKWGFFVIIEKSVGDFCLHSVDCFRVNMKISSKIFMDICEKHYEMNTYQLEEKV